MPSQLHDLIEARLENVEQLARELRSALLRFNDADADGLDPVRVGRAVRSIDSAATLLSREGDQMRKSASAWLDAQHVPW